MNEMAPSDGIRCQHENTNEVESLTFTTAQYEPGSWKRKTTVHTVYACEDCGRLLNGELEPMSGADLDKHVATLLKPILDKLEMIQNDSTEMFRALSDRIINVD